MPTQPSPPPQEPPTPSAPVAHQTRMCISCPPGVAPGFAVTTENECEVCDSKSSGHKG